LRVTIAIAIAALAIAVAAGDARAEPAHRHRHAFFVEALGKGGTWGLGYSYELAPRVALGAVASYTRVDGQDATTIAPYVELVAARRGPHRWFVDAGPVLAHLVTRSPVPEWPGTSSTGLGAEVATGYELRARVVVRGYVMMSAGANGVAPWLGVGIGWSP
jgi:hypothetical protein